MTSLSKEIEPTPKPIDVETGLDLSVDETPFMGVTSGGTYTKVDPTKYAKYFDDQVHTEFGTEYLDPLRATRQGFLEQTGGALLQSGAEIVGGTLEGLGYLGDVEQTINAVGGVEQEWGNWLSDIGKSMKTWSQEVAPVYQHPDDIGKFTPWRYSWWASNAPSMASTLSLLIPAAGVVKGASMVGKFLNIGSQLGKTAKLTGTILGQATVSRLMENGMEASQAYDSMLQEQLALGVPYEEATMNAGVHASDLWNKEWLLMIQDIPSYALLGGSISSARKALTKEGAKLLGKPTTGLVARSGLALFGDAVSEGGEEVFQYVMADRASKLARASLDKDYKYDPSFKEYFRDQELWNSFALGALGSGVFQTAGRKINNFIDKQAGRETESQKRVSTYLNWSPQIKNAQDAVLVAKASGNPKNIDTAINELGTVLAARSSESGDVKSLKDTLQQIQENTLDENVAKNLKISPEQQEFIKNNFPKVNQTIDTVAKYFETYAKKYDRNIAANLAANDVRREFATDNLNTLNDQLSNLEKTIPNLSQLSLSGQTIAKSVATKRALQAQVKEHEKVLEIDKTLTKDDQKYINNRIKRLNKDIEASQNIIEEAKKSQTKEDLEKDKALKLDSANLIEYHTLLGQIEEAKKNKEHLEHYDEIFKAVQSKRKKVKKDTSRKVEPDLTSEQPTTDNIEDTSTEQPDVQTDEDTQITDLEAEISSQVDNKYELEKRQKLAKGSNTKKADIEKRRKEELIVDGKLVYETGKDRNGKEYPGGWLQHEEEVNAKYDAELATLNPKDKSSTPAQDKASEEKPLKLTNVADDGIEESYEDDFEIDPNTGEVISLTPPSHSLTQETPSKDDSIIEPLDADEQVEDDPIHIEDGFDELADSTTFINLQRKKGANTELNKFIDNPKKRLSAYEVLFSIDLEEQFEKEFGKEAAAIRKRIEDGDLTLLEAGDALTSIVDSLPLRGVIRSKTTKKEIPGSLYLPKSSTFSSKMGDNTRKVVQRNTRVYRQKVLEGLLQNKEVTVANLKRSAGVPNHKANTQEKVASALNVNIKTMPLGIGTAAGAIIDASGAKERRTLPGKHSNQAGSLFAYTTALNNKPNPIKLNGTKLSEEDAKLVFDLFLKVFENKGLYNVEVKHPLIKGHTTIGQALNTLVYNGKSNTMQVQNSPRFREELIPKQLWFDSTFGNIIYGKNILDLNNYTKQDVEDFVEHLTTYKNYAISLKSINNPVKNPIKIGSFEVTEADIKSGMTYKEAIFKHGYLTTDVVTTEQGSTHKDSDVYTEVSDIDSVQYNDKPAEERVVDKPTTKPVSTDKMSDEEADKLLRDIQGLEDFRVYEGNQNFVSGNMEEEAAHIKKNLLGKDIDIQLVDDFIRVITKTGTITAFGSYRDSLIKLYKEAEVGTGYHEAFHAVFQLYLTPEQQEAILNEASKRYGLERSYDRKLKGLINNIKEISAFEGMSFEEKLEYKSSDTYEELFAVGQTIYTTTFEGETLKMTADNLEDFINYIRTTITPLKSTPAADQGFLDTLNLGDDMFSALDKTDAYKNLTNDRKLEEYLAEEFRNYNLTEGKVKPQPGAIKRFFRNLFNFIKSLFIDPNTSVKQIDIDGLFERISNGHYKYTKPTEEALARIDSEEYYSAFNEITGFTATQKHAMTKQLLYQVVRHTNIMSLKDVQDISFEPIKQWVNDQINVRLKPNLEKNEKIDNLYNIFSAVEDNFDNFKSLVEDMLLSLNIRKVEEFEEDYTKNEFDKHIKESYEYSSRDNMRANIKLFIATIPSNDTDAFTGMATIVDFDTAWRKLSKELHMANNPEEMMELLKAKAQTDRFYKTVLKGHKHRFGLQNASDTFKTQFWQTLKKHRHDYVKVLSDPRGKRFTFQNAELLALASAVKSAWSISFSLDSGLINPTTTKVNETQVKKLINAFDHVHSSFLKELSKTTNHAEIPNLDIYLDNLSILIKRLGINVTVDNLKSILADSKLPVGEALQELLKKDLSYIFDIKVGFLGNLLRSNLTDTLQDKIKLFNDDKAIHRFANKVADLNEDNIASTVLGPDNNQYYTYAANNYLTDFINQINRDPDYATNLSKIAGHNNSMFLSQIRNGARLNFKTLLGIKEDSQTKDYFDIDDQQDYLLKSVALLKGYFVLPTISDKKTYGWLEGIDKINFIEGAYLNEQGNYEYPEEVYKLFQGYYQNETDRISKATADIVNAEKSNDYSGLIENFHYQNLDADNKPILRDENDKFTGNGTKRIMFADYADELTRADIRKLLTQIVTKELKTAIEYKIINGRLNEDGSIDYKKSFLNNSLPQDIFKEHKKVFKDNTRTIFNMVSDYSINHVIGMIETGLLLSGDPAFYKTLPNTVSPFEDMTKRLAELTAPGDNMRLGFTEDEYDSGIIDGDTYSTAVINSHIFSSDELYKHLEELFKEQLKETIGDNLTNLQLDLLVANKLKAYKKVDSTDGQAYISPRMYRQTLIRLGEWTDAMNFAYNRVISGADQSLATLREDIRVLMQPLKLVHYGTYLRNGLNIPIYDKMSTAVLLPQMVKDTKMQSLYDRMMDETDPIDMIKFDSATKVGNTTRPDYITSDNEVDSEWIKNINIQHQSFKHLRRQQITDPHEDERRSVGTQVKKIILQNLKLVERIYKLNNKKLTGSEIANEISKLYSSISDRGRYDLEKTLKIKNNKVNNKAFRKLLKRAALQSNMPYNLVDSLDNTNIALDTLPDRYWTESKMISKVGQKTIDLVTAGDSFIQMSAYGFDNVNSKEVSDLKLFDSKGRTEVKVSVGLFKDVIPNYNELSFEEKRKWLKEEFEGIGYRIPTQSMGSVISFVVVDFLPEETGNVIMLPLEFTALTGSDFDIDKLFLMRYSYHTDIYNNPVKYNFIEGTEEGTVETNEDLEEIYKQVYAEKLRAIEELKQIQKDQTLNPAIRYAHFTRVLRDRLDANKLFEIEDILTDVEDIRTTDINTIFEVFDKQFVTIEKFIEDNKGKDAYQINHTKALENRIIDIMKSVITNPNHIIDTKTSIDSHTDLLKTILKEIDDLRGKDIGYKGLSWYGLSSQSQAKLYYIGGKDGIGPFALHNVNHALTQIANVNITTALDAFAGRTFEDDSEYGKGNLARVYDKNGNVITDWFSALINAHVDIAKDPYIFRLNVNRNTYAATSYLLRLGFGSNTFLFLNQPVLTEIQGDPDKAKVKNTQYLKKAKKLALEEGKDPEKIEHLSSYWSSPLNIFKNSGLLLKQLNQKTEKNAEWYATQAGIASALGKVNREAERLQKLVRISRLDNKGYGTNLGQVRLFKRNMERILLDNRFQNLDKMFHNTFIKTLKENSVDFIQDIYSNLTITSTDKFLTMLDAMVKMSPVQEIQNDKIWLYKTQKLSRELFSSLVSNYFTSTAGRLLDKENVKDMLYGENSIAKQINNLKNSESKYKDNLLLKHLIPVHDETTSLWLLYTRSDVSNDAWSKNILTGAWQELLSAPEIEVKALAQQLVDYSFMMSGFNKTLFSFYHYIPVSYLVDNPGILEDSLTYNDFIKELTRELTNAESEYGDYYSNIKDVFLNNDEYIDLTEDPKEVILKSKKGNPLVVEVRANSDLKISAEGNIVTIPFIKMIHQGDEYLLEYVGHSTKPRDEFDRPLFIYKVVPKKGFDYRGHVLSEYGLGEESIIQKNNTIHITDEQEKEYLNSKLKDFIYVPQEERLTAYTHVVDVQKLNLSDMVKDFMRGDIKDLKMTSDNIEKIKKGLKTTTSRTSEATPGLYRISDDTVIDITNVIHYENISDMLDRESWAVAEGFTNLEDMRKNAKFQHTKDFIDGKRGLYVYDFVVAEDIAPKEPSAIDAIKEDDSPITDVSAFSAEMDLFLEEEGFGEQKISLNKVISGFQTGVDTLGLEVAKSLGLETGGTTTPGYYREGGSNPSLASEYNVTEISSKLQDSKKGREFYLPRTEQNVLNSDGTVYFATDEDSAGKIATKRYANANNKPFLLNPTSKELKKWLLTFNIKILNVAGNRGSRLSEDKQNEIKNILKTALKPEKDKEYEVRDQGIDSSKNYTSDQTETESFKELLDFVKTNYGSVEMEKVQKALDTYNESDLSKKLVDKLKDCLV